MHFLRKLCVNMGTLYLQQHIMQETNLKQC